MPKHQIVWAVSCHCGLGGVIGMHYFSQMTWPVGFFIFSQLPNHLHYSLMGPLYQPVHLGMGVCGLQLLYTEEFAHLTNNLACGLHHDYLEAGPGLQRLRCNPDTNTWQLSLQSGQGSHMP